MQPKILTEPKFVGREQELTKLEQYLKQAIRGKGSTIFISGEAGTGKTRLTKEFLKRIKDKRLSVLSGWCLSETTIPYFPFVGDVRPPNSDLHLLFKAFSPLHDR